jgi:AcrR family transcriptional regulator
VTESKRKLNTHDRAATARTIGGRRHAISKKGYESTTTRGLADAANCAEALIQRY